MSARPVWLALKLACAFALLVRLPTALSQPLHSSVTFLEETAPVKLPGMQCSLPGFTGFRVRPRIHSEWYFNGASIPARTGTSKAPTYPTQNILVANTSLQ